MRYARPIAVLFFSLFLTTLVTAQEPAAAESAAPGKLAIGEPVPNFKLKSLGDKPVVLSERFGAEGKPVILLFSRANW